DRRAEHQQQRRQRGVLDRRELDGRVHCPAPFSATPGLSTWALDKVVVTAGLITSSSGLGKNPKPMISATSGARTHTSRALRSLNALTGSAVGPFSARCTIHRM